MSERAPIVVIGVGNTMRRDDGVGAAVIAALPEQAGVDAAVDVVALDGEPTRLLEAWRDRRLAIVVDAARGAADPGTLHEVVVGRDPLPAWSSVGSTHAAGVEAAVDLAGALDRLPEQLVILGVEARDLSHGTALSPEVGAAIPAVVDHIGALITRSRAG